MNSLNCAAVRVHRVFSNLGNLRSFLGRKGGGGGIAILATVVESVRV